MFGRRAARPLVPDPGRSHAVVMTASGRNHQGAECLGGGRGQRPIHWATRENRALIMRAGQPELDFKAPAAGNEK